MALILGAELGMGFPIFVWVTFMGRPLNKDIFWGVYIGDPCLAKLRNQGAWGTLQKSIRMVDGPEQYKRVSR